MAKTQRHRCLHRCHERQRRLQTAWRSAPQFGCCHFSFRDWVCQDWKSLQLVLIPGMTFIYINFMFIYIFILLYINIYIYSYIFILSHAFLLYRYYLRIVCLSFIFWCSSRAKSFGVQPQLVICSPNPSAIKRPFGDGLYHPFTLWLFNIAMGHRPFIDGLPIKHCDFPWLCKITRWYIQKNDTSGKS